MWDVRTYVEWVSRGVDGGEGGRRERGLAGCMHRLEGRHSFA